MEKQLKSDLIQLLSDIESNSTFYKSFVKQDREFDLDAMIIVLEGNVKRLKDKINEQ